MVYILGLCFLISIIVLIFTIMKSRSEAFEEIESSSEIAPPIYSNDEAVDLARQYFQQYKKRSIRSFAKYILYDKDLPVTYNAPRFSLVITPVFCLLMGLGSIFLVLDMKPFEIAFILVFIPIPGIILNLIPIVFICLGVYFFKNIFIHWDSKLIIDPLSIKYVSKSGQIYLKYQDFHILFTPAGGDFSLEITPKDNSNIDPLSSFIRSYSMILRKKIFSTLIAKSIEYGNFHAAAGWTF